MSWPSAHRLVQDRLRPGAAWAHWSDPPPPPTASHDTRSLNSRKNHRPPTQRAYPSSWHPSPLPGLVAVAPISAPAQPGGSRPRRAVRPWCEIQRDHHRRRCRLGVLERAL
jgi:hypothetical protein